jgi:hypothetical protein
MREHRGQNVARGLPREGAPPGEHFVQECADREQVGAAINGEAPRLLGRHVRCGADDDTGPRRSTSSPAHASARNTPRSPAGRVCAW